MKKLLYIHNKAIKNPKTGSLNTTLLQVFSMCIAFEKNGYDVILALEGGGSMPEALDEFINKSFLQRRHFKLTGWVRMSKISFLNRLLVIRQITKIVKEVEPDVIYTREPINIYPLINKNMPTVFESHDSRLSQRFSIIDKLLKQVVINSSKKNDFKFLVSISQSLSDYWAAQGIERNKLLSYHDGFDHMLFDKQLTKSEARKALGLSEDISIAVYAGGLYPEREIDQLISLANNYCDTKILVIGGPSPNHVTYQKIASDKGVENIQFIGYIPHNQIPQYLYAADILLALWSKKVPTINYCSPLKLFEYMAAGRVIVTHNFPTIREVLTPNQDAIFVEPGSLEDLVNAFKIALMASKDNWLGINARKKAYEKYTWDKRAEAILERIDLSLL